MQRMLVSSQVHVEILMLSVVVLGCGGFGGCLDHEGGALISGISAFIKEDPESSLVPFTMWGHSEKFLLFMNYPICVILLQAAWTDSEISWS